MVLLILTFNLIDKLYQIIYQTFFIIVIFNNKFMNIKI